MFICTDINWSGDCGHANQPLNKCIVLGSEWKDKISSFGPDECTRCFGFGCVTQFSSRLAMLMGAAARSLNDCSIVLPPAFSQEWQFDWPGDSTGGLGKPNPWNDKIESFKCQQFC